MAFLSVNEAIRVLRNGRKDSQWFEAASFLIERASPEVKLMLEVGRELEKRDQRDAANTRQRFAVTKWLLVLLSISLLAIGSGYVGWLIMSGIGIKCP